MIFDCEGDGLTPSKFYVLSYYDGEKIVSITSHDEMRKWLKNQKLLIGHNIIRWDIPNLERVLNIKIKAKLIDTLALSWYLWDKREAHSLENWGEEFNIPKVVIENWEELPLEDYIKRCEEDVKITNMLWDNIVIYLRTLYDYTEDITTLPIISYLSFKLDCAREQEHSQWKLDREKCLANIIKFENIKIEKENIVKRLMPKVEKFVPRSPPAKPFKKDGTLSATGVRWMSLLKEKGLTFPHNDVIMIHSHWEEPNPSSPQQVKDWLFSLGWKPRTFKYVREEDSSVRAIPQIKKLLEPEFCDSVKELYEKEPQLEELEGLSIVNHRIGILKGFLEEEQDGYLKAEITGLTNTLRFKHRKPCVNLPGITKLYGKEVRECLIARDGYELVGSDLSALEDLTKRHFIYPFDPEYVEEMSQPGFDPHLDLAVRSGVLTEEQVKNHKAGIEKHNGIRQDYKKVNYSATYKIGADKLARELRCSRTKAAQLLKDFWERNRAIKAVADSLLIKEVKGQKWLFNPVSHFYYSLREEKDKFSTLNQGTGVYCFDKWIYNFRQKRPQLTAQFHDEVVLEEKKENREKIVSLLQEAIKKTNEQIKLNIQLSIDIKFGENYANVH